METASLLIQKVGVVLSGTARDAEKLQARRVGARILIKAVDMLRV